MCLGNPSSVLFWVSESEVEMSRSDIWCLYYFLVCILFDVCSTFLRPQTCCIYYFWRACIITFGVLILGAYIFSAHIMLGAYIPYGVYTSVACMYLEHILLFSARIYFVHIRS